ncbi:MAG: hypothetical protein P8Z30_01995 [Acidobacteriota bacterium]
MIWVLETGILLVVAVVLRRVLHMGDKSVALAASPHIRRSVSSPLYTPIASEVEAHITILGVLLNDAIEERNAGHFTLALRILSLFESEWSRLTELVVSLQKLSLKYLPMAQTSITPRNLNARSFQSHRMNEFFRRHGVLDQFVFRSKLRFQLHLRLLRRATSVLSDDFEEARQDFDQDTSLFAWTLTEHDLYFHDLDLLSKETLLGFCEELACLPDAALDEIAAEIPALIRNSVCGSIATPAHR